MLRSTALNITVISAMTHSVQFSGCVPTVYDQTSWSDRDRATTMKNIKGVADFVRLRVLTGSLSKVLDAAVTLKLELE
jgi:hypothetical protein